MTSYIGTIKIYSPLWVVLITLLASCKKQDQVVSGREDNAGPPIFTLMPPQQTGITFQNTLTEGPNTNILVYEYFYNGGGVAAGDLNGDGLFDLYFTANMEDNKLYLNKGNLQFQEVTAQSGATGRPGPWKTGVAMIDINGDSRLDIYISYSGMLPEEKRVNQLYINKGNNAESIPVFEEGAAQYGLASPAFSNQIYFFDYDRDADLDAILLNHNPKNLPILNVESSKQMVQQDDPMMGLRLLKNNNGLYEDVSKKSGISCSGLSYGLGVGITDFNNDGRPDFYVSNDYAVPDYLYINNHDGTFTDKLAESLGHNSQFSMGNDVGDVNNDGLPDIVTLDMLPEDNRRQKLLMAPDNYAKYDLNVHSGFHHQIMRNMLQLNNGNGTFSEIGQLAGISNTDWSWTALLADYNNDSWKDLFITNGYLKDYTNLDFLNYMDTYVKSKGRLVREDVLEIIQHMPASQVANYIFSNQQGQGFIDETQSWGMNRPSNSNGAVYADLDNDGDLDLVVNNINQPAYVYRNETSENKSRHYLQVVLRGKAMNTLGIGAKVVVYGQGKMFVGEQYLSKGYLSSVSPVLHFGLGSSTTIDSLRVLWPTGKQQLLTNVGVDQRLELKEEEAGNGTPPAIKVQPIFKQVPAPIVYQSPQLDINDFDRQPLLISQFSYAGPFMANADINGDGMEDVFIGGGGGGLFAQQKNGHFKKLPCPALQADRALEDAAAVFFDANGDLHPDLYVASGGYHSYQPHDQSLQDRLYINDGKGNFVKKPAALPSMLGSKGCVVVNDVNQDGHPDLFVGGRVVPGRYPEPPASYWLVNDGKGNFTDQIASLAPDLQQLGMITDAAWVDLNADKQMELVVVGEWLPITVFVNEGGKFRNKTTDFFDKEYKGWWNALEVTDLNGDEVPDLVAGNMGTNTQFRVSDQELAEMYYKDFDNNGAVDPIFCFYIQGKSYPYVTRDEMLRQLGSLRQRFTTYESYADVILADIFKKQELSSARHLSANHMETTYFVGSRDGKFEKKSMPKEAQYAPIYTITVLDANKDGHADLLLCGNNSKTKLRLGKFDANYGVLLVGDGKGGFTYVDQVTSGLNLHGDVRSTLPLGSTLLFGICRESIIAYEF